jgi:NitT/TauT family transport system substrate-binding protein
MKKLVVVLGIVVFLFGATAGAFAADDVIKIGHLRITTSLATYVAQEKGLFEKEGLKVELIPFDSGTTIMDALLAGRIDVVGTAAITSFWFAAQAAPERFKIFLTFGTPSLKNPTFVAIVKKDSPLKSLKDLKGKKVGTYPGATSVALAKAIIHTQMDPKEVIYTELPPPTLISALAAGQIDAFFAPEPDGMTARAKGVGRDLVKEPLGLLGIKQGFAGAAYGFSTKFLNENPERAKKLKAAYYAAADLINKDKDAYRPLLVKYAGVTDEVAKEVPIQLWMKVETLNKQSTQKYFDILYKQGAFQQQLDTTKLYYEN